MEKSPLSNILGFIAIVIAVALGTILLGIWIPKCSFMPKRVNIKAHYEVRKGTPGLLIQNHEDFGLREVVIDVNGSCWSEGYIHRIKFIAGRGDTYWLKLSNLRKHSERFPPDADIKRVEIYGLTERSKFYRKFTLYQMK